MKDFSLSLSAGTFGKTRRNLTQVAQNETEIISHLHTKRKINEIRFWQNVGSVNDVPCYLHNEHSQFPFPQLFLFLYSRKKESREAC